MRRFYQLRKMTWKMVSRPNEKKPISVKWIYNEKKNAKEELERYKARLMVKDCSQKHEIDFDEIFCSSC